MYIETVPNRGSPPAILLRESYRVGDKVKKRTLLNLSDWPRNVVEGLRALLKGAVLPSGGDRCRTATWPPCSARCEASGSTNYGGRRATVAAILS